MQKYKASLRGRLMVKIISLFMDSPFGKDKGFLENGYRISRMKQHWKVPKGYDFKKFDLNGTPVEILSSKESINSNKIILHFHGGAYIFRYFDFYRMVAHKYAKLYKKAKIVSIDYRTVPYHTFPDALKDALKVWNYLLEEGYKAEDIIVVGDSAGGNLALSLTMKLRDDKKDLPRALVLMSPWTDLDAKGESYNYNVHNDPIFGKKKGKKEPKAERMHHLLRAYAGDTDFKNKYLSVAYGEFYNFPPMLIQVGSHEVLESDSIVVYEKAKNENVEVKLTRYYGMFHDFQMLFNFLPEGKAAWKEVKIYINNQFEKK